MIDLEEFKKMRESEHLIVFDTNILLELYRKPSNISLDIIEAFKKVIDRIYVPRQVYDEYLRNYQKVCGDEKRKDRKVGTELAGSLTKLQEDIASKTTEYRKHDYTDITKLQSDLREKIEEIRNILKDYEENHRYELKKDKDFLQNDKVKEFIDLLAEHGNIGDPFPFSKKLLILQEGQIRFDNLIPPGYKDNAKAGVDKYGDLLVWKSIIEVAKEQNTNILFICNDIKEDWWEKNKELPIEIRQELLEEFKENNPSLNINFLTLEKFFSYIAEELKIGQSKSALQLSAMEYVEKNLQQHKSSIDFETQKLFTQMNLKDILGEGVVLSQDDTIAFDWGIRDVSVEKKEKDIIYYIDLDISLLADVYEENENMKKVAVAWDGKVVLHTEEYSHISRITDISLGTADVSFIEYNVWNIMPKNIKNSSCREIISAYNEIIENQDNTLNNFDNLRKLGSIFQKYTMDYDGIVEAMKPLTALTSASQMVEAVKPLTALTSAAQMAEAVKPLTALTSASQMAEAMKPLTALTSAAQMAEAVKPLMALTSASQMAEAINIPDGNE